MTLPKPILIYDGDCDFCGCWIERWKKVSIGAVDYEPYQSAAKGFPAYRRKPSPGPFHGSSPTVTVFSGAAAVFAALATGSGIWRHVMRFYLSQGWFAWVAEALYSLVAKNRRFVSMVTRILLVDHPGRCAGWRKPAALDIPARSLRGRMGRKRMRKSHRAIEDDEPVLHAEPEVP